MVDKQALIRAYYEGLREGISLYAHWKDGVCYVGTCGQTLKDATAQINQDEQRELDRNANAVHREVASTLGYARIGLNNV